MFTSMIIFIVICTLSDFANAASTYDQSQTGELNVQVDLRDVQIIALMKSGKEEYVDYDYAYDYSEMTIKPQNGTTPKPLSSSSTASDVLKDKTTIGTTVVVETTTELTEPIKNSTVPSLDTAAVTVTEHPVNNESTTATKTTVEYTTKAPEVSEVTVAAIPTVTSNSTTASNCKKGFILNQKGGCEFKLQSASNALLKIIKLSQKLKRRENGKELEDEQNK